MGAPMFQPKLILAAAVALALGAEVLFVRPAPGPAASIRPAQLYEACTKIHPNSRHGVQPECQGAAKAWVLSLQAR